MPLTATPLSESFFSTSWPVLPPAPVISTLELLESSALQGATLGLDLATLAGVLLAASPGPRDAGAAFVYTILKC